jgi:hypothetical protein
MTTRVSEKPRRIGQRFKPKEFNLGEKPRLAPHQPYTHCPNRIPLFQTEYLFSWWLCLDAQFPMSFRNNVYLALKVLFWGHFLFSFFLLSKRKGKKKKKPQQL